MSASPTNSCCVILRVSRAAASCQNRASSSASRVLTRAFSASHPGPPSPRRRGGRWRPHSAAGGSARAGWRSRPAGPAARSEEHTSELQSHSDVVCRLLLGKKKRRKRCLVLVAIQRKVSSLIAFLVRLHVGPLARAVRVLTTTQDGEVTRPLVGELGSTVL